MNARQRKKYWKKRWAHWTRHWGAILKADELTYQMFLNQKG
jgi:hypothetical protein